MTKEREPPSRKGIIVTAAPESNRIRHIGVYQLKEEIGEGAMGKVYRAIHQTLQKEVALKLIHLDDPSGEVVQRFLQEGVAASRVRHPNVVEILDAGTSGGRAYMAMQLLEGETLAECLLRQGRLPVTYAIDLILPVCAALVAAHESGVLHRDLKPANIFLNEVGRGDPEPMLLDFGISKILGPIDAELTQNPRFLGTPLYISPEQADGEHGTAKSDQYALALTLYETLLGVRPFAKFKNSLIQLLRHVAEGDIRSPRELDASLPEELDEAISRALSREPGARFASVRDFGAALLPFASEARRTLWQHAFIDTERTLTSANAPVSSRKSSRRVHVSVTPSNPAPFQNTGLDGETGREEFLSHSSLFGPVSRDNIQTRVEGEKSSISRRGAALHAPLRPQGADPYSQAPSYRDSGDWSQDDSSRRLGRRTGVDARGLGLSSQSAASESHFPSARSPLVLFLSVTLALLGIAATVALVRHEMAAQNADSFEVDLTVTPSDALLSLDGQPVGTGRFRGTFKKDGQVHRLRVELAEFEPVTLIFQDGPPPKTLTLEKARKPANSPEFPASVAAPSPQAQNMTAGDKSPTPTARPSSAASATSAASASSASTSTLSTPSAPFSANGTAVPSQTSTAPAGTTTEGGPSSAQTSPTKKPIQTGNLDPWAK